MKIDKNELVKNQVGFSTYVDLKENAGLDFDSITINSGFMLTYKNEAGMKRRRIIRHMDWEGNPWAAEKKIL